MISGNACYHLVQNILYSSLLPKNINIKICRTIILPVVLYSCETWSFTLREESKWTKLHNEELSDLFSSLNIVRVTISRRMRQVGHVARMGERRGVYRVVVGKPGKPERKRPFGNPFLHGEDNIKIDIQEVG